MGSNHINLAIEAEGNGNLVAFIQIIQKNLPTAVMFWFAFLVSIMISKAYQKRCISNDPEASASIRHMSKIERIAWTLLIIILPSLLIGFRHYEVGADTMNLVIGYSRLSFEHTSIIIWDRILYSLLRYTSFLLSNGNPTFFLFTMTFLTLFILVRALDKWADKISIPLALFVYYALFGMQLLNQSRQLIALSILLYAIPYLLARKSTKYLWFVFIASLFHFTASIGIVFALLHFKKGYFAPIKKALFYLSWLLSPILMYPFLILLNRIIPSSYSGYIEIATYGGVGLGLVITIFPVVVPIFLFKRYLVDYTSKYLSRVALLTYPLRFAGYYSYFLMRLNYYSSVFMVLLIPILVGNVKSRSKRRLVRFIVIVVLMTYYVVHYMFLDAGSIFPYRNILMN